GIESTDPATVLRSPALAQVCGVLVGEARKHFVEARTIMARSPRRTVRAPRIMGEVYRAMLDGMVVRGWDAPRTRARVRRTQLAWILLRYAIVGWRERATSSAPGLPALPPRSSSRRGASAYPCTRLPQRRAAAAAPTTTTASA